MQYFLLVLLLLGVAAYAVNKIYRFRLYRIPPSLLAGSVVLAVFSAIPETKNSNFFLHLKTLPAEFIALVFACFLLQRREVSHPDTARMHDVLAQTSLIWVSVMGQVLIGLVATLVVYRPLFAQPLAFASVLEAGFAGGHGTAVALGPILAQNGLTAGLEYSLFSATVGLVLGITGGIWLIRHARAEIKITVDNGDLLKTEFEVQGMLFSMALIAAAYWLGIFYKGIFERELLPRLAGREQTINFSLPLFAYALLGGYTVRRLAEFLGFVHLINNQQILFLADVFLEILIFSGIAIIDVRLLGEGLIPLLSLFALGFGWNVFCHFIVRPRILNPGYSFELGLINFGMLNGTAATGLMLLKMVDPKFKTLAAKVFAESSALTQPFIAGGILTLTTPYIVSHLPPALSLTLYSGLLLFWLVVGLITRRRFFR